MKKFYIIIFFIAALLIFLGIILGIYFFINTEKKTEEEIEPMTIGYNYWPGVLPIFVAEKMGYFKDEGLMVSLNFYEDYIELLEAINIGRVDLANDIVLVDAINLYFKDKKIKVIGASDYSMGADGLVVDERIKNSQDLKGKIIAVEKDTVGEYLLYAILYRYNLDPKDIIIANLSASDGVSAFLDKKVDGVISYEPDLSRAKRRKDSRLFSGSSSFPGLIMDVITVNSNFLVKNPASIAAFLRGYFRAVEYIKANPEASIEIGAEYFSILPEEFNEGFELIKLLDYKDNIVALSYAGGYKSIYGSGKYLVGLLVEQDKITNYFNWEDLIETSHFNNIDFR